MDRLQKIVSQATALTVLRYSLGVTFIWFGLLKLFAVSPVTDMVKRAMPGQLANMPTFFLLLAILEIAIGIGFFTKHLVKFSALIMIGHLTVATLSVLVTQGFSPYFPVLTLPGEFVAKNLVLMAAGIVLLVQVEPPKGEVDV